MAWQTPNKRRHLATQEALRGIVSRLCDLETAPRPALELEPIRQELTDIRTSLSAERHETDQLISAVGALERQAKEFLHALSEGIERTDRAERRIKATVARARKELRARGMEDPNLESEAFELRERDGERGDESGVLELHGEVEEPAKESSIRGVTADTLRKVRGW